MTTTKVCVLSILLCGVGESADLHRALEARFKNGDSTAIEEAAELPIPDYLQGPEEMRLWMVWWKEREKRKTSNVDENGRKVLGPSILKSATDVGMERNLIVEPQPEEIQGNNNLLFLFLALLAASLGIGFLVTRRSVHRR